MTRVRKYIKILQLFWAVLRGKSAYARGGARIFKALNGEEVLNYLADPSSTPKRVVVSVYAVGRSNTGIRVLINCYSLTDLGPGFHGWLALDDVLEMYRRS